MDTFTIIAWIIITIMSFFIMPFFTIAIIFYGTNMPIFAGIFISFGLINMVYKIAVILDEI